MFQSSKTGSLFTSAFQVCESKQQRLSNSWGQHFYARCLPLIREEDFRALYSENGAPCKSIRLVVASLILEAYFDYTDEETQQHIDFDLRWHLALGLDPCEEQDYVSQRTLQYFRAHLLHHDLIRHFFADTTDQLIKAFGLSTAKQRIDSTHILSNFAQLTRLRLFCETLRVFLRTLSQCHADRYAQLPQTLRDRYHTLDGEASHYDDARSSETRRRLSVCARDAYRLLTNFQEGLSPEMTFTYQLLSRLIDEQCDLVETPQLAESSDGDHDLPAVPIQLKAAKSIASSVMQTPHDPDVTYSGHKGQGYDALLAETYDEANPFQVITLGSLEPACGSDADRLLPAVEALEVRGLLPEDLLADTTFGSTENYLACTQHGITLTAPVPGKSAPQGSSDEAWVLAAERFDIDLLGKSPTICPQGIPAVATILLPHHTPPIAIIHMAREACAQCPLAGKCARLAKNDGTEVIMIELQPYSLARRRALEKTVTFQDAYRPRGGIEGTNSELKRGHGLGDLRVRGDKHVELAVLLRLLACNMKRAIQYCQKQTKQQTSILRETAEKIGANADKKFIETTKLSLSY